MSDLILALDFGGTKLTAALTSKSAVDEVTGAAAASKKWQAHRRVNSPPRAEAAYDQATMIRLGNELLAGRAPAGIGVSFGGPVAADSGVVRLSHHVPGWENFALQRRLEDEFGAPVCVDNDANVAAFGEYRFGAGRGHHHLMYITVSTGVGGGWVLNGRPWRGHEGMAGEIGHMVVDPNGPTCLCGKRGCVERLASGPFMAEDLKEAWLAVQEQTSGIEADANPEGTNAGKNLDKGEIRVSGKMVAEAAAAGDGVALEILMRGAGALGAGIGNTANLVNPQRFVLGGGVTKAGDHWWAAVRRSARRTALPEVHFDIVPAALGDDAPLWGAAALAVEMVAGA